MGRLAVRDITDNSDAIIDATVDAGSTTAGNIQIGTNHIESTNANGAISLRPNGAGNIALAANVVMLGKGGAFTLVGTGIQTDAGLGINYTPSNIIVQTSGALSSGNVRVSMTTAASSTTTGALQVMGGVGVVGAAFIGGLTTTAGINSSANILATGGTFSSAQVNGTLASTGLATLAGINSSANILATGATFNSERVNGTSTVNVLNSTGNILATGGVLNSLTVNGNITVTTAYVMPSANAASSLGSSAARWNFVYGVNGNFLSVNANYADLAEKYVADAAYAPGTVLMFGGDKEVTQCVHDMCSRVAGVVSTNPAYLMNSGLEGEYTVELALTGRVPTRVRGPILKGDLIVSAGDGYARAEGIPQVGTVIGKALEDFDGDTGVIEVVVGKH
jgi:hypothetical protein